MGWVNPTGFEDPDTAWTNETLAYNDNTGDGASVLPDTGAYSWSSFLVFMHVALLCNKVQFWASWVANNYEIDIDVYYGDAWHDVYSGTFAHQEWVEKSLGGAYSVTKARVSFYNNTASAAGQGIREFDFWEVPAVPHSFGFVMG